MSQENGQLKKFDTPTILDVINNVVMRHYDGNHDVLETILSVSAIPAHPLNADLLSKYLSKFDLAERDSIWIPFLNSKFNTSSALDRLLYWSVKVSHNSSYDQESIKLVGIALTWCLSSSNRYVRDAATKSLVFLLRKRILILKEILKEFEDCDDRYIQERLFAIAYGCSLWTDDDNLVSLGVYVYRNIFMNGCPPVHFLMRDYARGVVEFTLKKHPEIKRRISVKKILPPYKSKWPKKFPTLKYLQREFADKKYGDKERNAFGSIWYSLMYNNGGGIADFGNYVLNSTIRQWSGEKLIGQKIPPKSLDQKKDYFIENLSSQQKNLWSKLKKAERGTFWPHFVVKTDKGETLMESPKNDNKKLQSANKKLKETTDKFENSLTPTMLKKYQNLFKLDLSRSRISNEPDTSAIQRWVFNKVIELGWTPELFYGIDSRVGERFRSPDKPERIGKKYQWIAFHEILARVADNFALKKDWENRYVVCQGPWQVLERNIDPSHAINLFEINSAENNWWFNITYNRWQKSLSHKEWIRKDDASQLIKDNFVVKDVDGVEWLVLDGYHKWREPKKPGTETFSSEYREVMIMSRAYIVKNNTAKKIYEWAKSKHISWGWMPKSFNIHGLYFREIPYSFAYERNMGRKIKLGGHRSKKTTISINLKYYQL